MHTLPFSKTQTQNRFNVQCIHGYLAFTSCRFPYLSPLNPFKDITTARSPAYPKYTTAIKALSTSAKGLATSTAIGDAALEEVEAAELEVLDAVWLEPAPEVVVAVAVEVFKLAWLRVVFLCKTVPVPAELAPLAPVPSGTNAVVVPFFGAAVKLETVELIDAIAAWRDVADGELELEMVETRDREVDVGVSEPPLKVNMPE